MRSLLRSIVAFFTLGICMAGCNQQGPSAPTDVTLHVPGMY
jgi:hypothetical protein